MRWTGRRLWWAGLVAAWAVGLLVAGIWSVHHDPPTVRAQSDLSSGARTVEAAAATLRELVAPVVSTAPTELTEITDCRLALGRTGQKLTQRLTFQVPDGQEQALLERLAEQLPEQWQARHYPSSQRFYADAGNFVTVRGEVSGSRAGQADVEHRLPPGAPARWLDQPAPVSSPGPQ